MTDRELIEIYKKEIEIFLGTLKIYKGNSIVNNNMKLNYENKQFIKEKMRKLKSNNLNDELLDIAIDELIPYLRQY